MKLVAGLMMALVAAPAVAADQFDLVCVAGKSRTHFRVDLAQNSWCWDQCKETQKIVSVSQAKIVFVDQKPHLQKDPTIWNWVDRETGKWTSYSYFPGIDLVPIRKEGFCEPGPFTGFPVIPTKF